MKPKLIAKLVFFIFFFFTSSILTAQKEENNQENYNLCTTYDKQHLEQLIQGGTNSLLEQFGLGAKDSINALALRIRKIYERQELFIQAKQKIFIPDTTSMNRMLVQIFRAQKSTADSIEALTKWVASVMIHSDNERNEELLMMTANEIYNLVMEGKASGDDMNFADFFCKIAFRYKGWGVPTVFSSITKDLPEAKFTQQQHCWVGFADSQGQIRCIVDPFIGGIVKSKVNQKVLSYSEVKQILNKTGTSHHSLMVAFPGPTLHSSAGCVMDFLIADNVSLTYYQQDNSNGFVKANWIMPDDPSHYTAPLLSTVWNEMGLAHLTYFNFYLLPHHAIAYTEDKIIANLLEKKYSIPVVVSHHL